MAKVIGPLFSQEASGTVAKSLTYARRRGQNIVRTYTIPSNPMTPDQIAVRITLAGAGYVLRRVRATDWTYAGQEQTWIEFLRGITRVGEVWNSALARIMIGPDRATYTSAFAQWNALDSGSQTLWTDEAEDTVGGLEDYTRGTVTVEAGFMLFWAERTVANNGYGNAFDQDTPFTLVAG